MYYNDSFSSCLLFQVETWMIHLHMNLYLNLHQTGTMTLSA